MELTLTAAESDLLRSTLDRAIGNLKMEISNTENFAMRNELKQDEVLLKAILERLQPAHAV
ncbi:MAG: hypothetical protein ABIQ47_11790 [Tepidiformaceae bacterium]